VLDFRDVEPYLLGCATHVGQSACLTWVSEPLR